jgi:hypothetical protein
VTQCHIAKDLWLQSFSKAIVRISDVANHLRITKIEGTNDIYETHYCVTLGGLLIVTED